MVAVFFLNNFFVSSWKETGIQRTTATNDTDNEVKRRVCVVSVCHCGVCVVCQCM